MNTPIGIAGLGFYVPERRLTNKDLEKTVDTNDEWIRSRTGILERRIAPEGSGTSDLSVRACEKALQAAGITADKVDLIIGATTTPDMPLPSAACLIQAKLGAKNAACFDLAAACAGFVYGLVTAEQFLRGGFYKTVLVVGADKISSYIDWSDRATCILFGDGAGAAVLSRSTQGAILGSVLGADGAQADLLKISAGGSKYPASRETVSQKEHYLKMNGAEVFKFAVRGMAEAVDGALKKAGVDKKDIACVIPHQANLRIIDAIANRLKISKEKIFVNLQKYGNTSSASCAIALSEALAEGKIKRGDIVVLATFGSGFVWGAMVIRW